MKLIIYISIVFSFLNFSLSLQETQKISYRDSHLLPGSEDYLSICEEADLRVLKNS